MIEKLIKLLQDNSYIDVLDEECWVCAAEQLLANGVILPPVWVGSTVYYIYDFSGNMYSKELRVVECAFDKQGLYSMRAEGFDGRMSLPFSRYHPYYSLDTLRFTKEEAEKALKKRREI